MQQRWIACPPEYRLMNRPNSPIIIKKRIGRKYESRVHSASADDMVMTDGYLLFQNVWTSGLLNTSLCASMMCCSRKPCSPDLNNVLYTRSFRTKADVTAGFSGYS